MPQARHGNGSWSRPYPRFIARHSSYRLGNMKETTPVKDFFIIVNRLLTIANGPGPALVATDDARRIEATVRLNTICEQE